MSSRGSTEPGSGSFDGVAQCRDTRNRLLDLGRPLSEEEGRAEVAATPLWSVKDVYSHLTGSVADVLSGNLDGITTDPWTAAQVESRRDRSLAEVLDEMESLGDDMDGLVESLGDAMDIRFFIDQWTHEQDVRGTLGSAGGTESPIVAKASPGMAKGWVRNSERAGLPPLTVVLDGATYAAGESNDPADGSDPGDAGGDGSAVVLTVDGYTALRVGLGRRSERQLGELDWRGTDDPSPWFGALVFFTIADRDVVDAL